MKGTLRRGRLLVGLGALVLAGLPASAQEAHAQGPPATLTLTPAFATNPVGTSHTVTATVRDAAGNPVPGVFVIFTAIHAPEGFRTTNLCPATDANGQCSFTYQKPIPTSGTDAITACADNNGDFFCSPDEPTGTATKVWTEEAAPPATLTLEPKTATNTVGTQHCVTATVRDAFGNPVPGVTVRFSAAGANSASGSAVTDANGQASFCYTGTTAGIDTITAFADTDGDGTQDAGEPGDTATKTWTPGAPATLTLDAAVATNPVGGRHTVTATVRDPFGNPVSGVTVRFMVTGAVTATGSCTTDGNGQCSFSYDGPLLPGADAITAYADSDGDSTQDAGEPTGAAEKTWVLPVSTPLCEVTIADGGRITAANGDKTTFGGHAKVPEEGAPSGQQTYQDHGPAQPMTVKSINVLAVVCSADRRQADLYGQATVDGAGSFDYRIQLEDNDQHGAGMDKYWILLSSGYSSGLQTLEAGQVRITVHE